MSEDGALTCHSSLGLGFLCSFFPAGIHGEQAVKSVGRL